MANVGADEDEAIGALVGGAVTVEVGEDVGVSAPRGINEGASVVESAAVGVGVGAVVVGTARDVVGEAGVGSESPAVVGDGVTASVSGTAVVVVAAIVVVVSSPPGTTTTRWPTRLICLSSAMP